ncbi:hypothetical protein TWF281_005307 [Arthrobotrys megalospora]
MENSSVKSNTPRDPRLSANPSLFLGLPREIRDEIYKCTLKGPIAPLNTNDVEDLYKRSHNNTPFAQDFGLPGLDINLLLVNRQIHDELSSLFYSRTVFPIRIAVGPADIYTYPSGHQHCFFARYIAPWEDVSFEWVAGTKIGGYRTGSAVLSRIKSTYLEESDLTRHPSPRYRHLIRQVRIEIIDVPSLIYPCATWSQALQKQAIRDSEGGRCYRSSSIPAWKREGMNSIAGNNYFDDRPSHVKIKSEADGPKLRALLMPFACRLQNILEDAGVSVNKDIRIISRPPQNPEGEEEHMISYFKELIELSYPFTRGQGKFKISTTLDAVLGSRSGQESFSRDRKPGLASGVIETCSRSPGFTPNVEEDFKNVSMTRGHNQGYWEMRNGILMVGRGRSFL